MRELLGDLFTSDAPALGHGVNTRGIMGAGIALQFKNRYPEMHEAYVKLCNMELFRPGTTFVYAPKDGSRYVYNMASQEFPGADARLELLEEAATLAGEDAVFRGFDRIAIPRIGCGIGGLDWTDVVPLLEDIEQRTGIEFEVWIS